MSYAGNYTFDGTTLSTRVDASSEASRVGGDQTRHVRFEGHLMVLAPPRMREDLRTGWVVRPGQPGELAGAVSAALAHNPTAAEALGARARQFAEFMFSPQSVAEAIRGVYTSLLSRDS